MDKNWRERAAETAVHKFGPLACNSLGRHSDGRAYRVGKSVIGSDVNGRFKRLLSFGILGCRGSSASASDFKPWVQFVRMQSSTCATRSFWRLRRRGCKKSSTTNI